MRGESADGTIDRGIALLTDGGEAVQEDQEEDAEQGGEQEEEQIEDVEEEEGGTDDEQEQEQETEDEQEEEQEGDAESEEQDEEAPDERSEEQEANEEEAEDEDEQDEQEESEDEAEIPEEDEDAEGVHSGGAESVYEGEEATGVLHLDLDGLALDLLGLEVHLDEVVLDVSARPGDNNLLGNLLSAVTGLLDSLAASPMEAVKNALGKAKDAVAGYLPSFGDIKDRLAGLLPSFGGIKDRIAGFLPNFGGIKDRIAGLVPSLGGVKNAILGLIPGVGRGGEEAPEDGEETEGEEESEAGDEAESEEGDESESPGVLARLKGWIGDKLRGALSALPIQEVAANVAREILRELIEQIESKDKQEPTEGGATAEAES